MTFIDEQRPAIARFIYSNCDLFLKIGPLSLYRKTISIAVMELIRLIRLSLFSRNDSLINLFTLFRNVAFFKPFATANPTRIDVCFEGNEKTNAFIGFSSYFFPRVITLVNASNPLNVSIDGCIRGSLTLPSSVN
jgi:hypothetical protein